MKDTCWRVSLRGDVTSPLCRTRSESHKFAKRFGFRLQHQSHYRFILDDIGRDLTSFETTKELVETLADALQGTRSKVSLDIYLPLLSSLQLIRTLFKMQKSSIVTLALATL